MCVRLFVLPRLRIVLWGTVPMLFALAALSCSTTGPDAAPSTPTSTLPGPEQSGAAPESGSRELEATDSTPPTTPGELDVVSPSEPSPGTQAPGDTEVAEELAPEEVEFGQSFLPLTSRLGFTRYLYAGRSSTGVVIYQYLPVDEEIATWTHMATVSVLVVGESWEDGSEQMPLYVRAMRRHALVIHEAGSFPDERGGVAVTWFEVGASPLPEHVLAATWQVLPGVVATFQAQQRPEPYSPEQVQNFMQLVAQLTQPGPDAGTGSPEAEGGAGAPQ